MPNPPPKQTDISLSLQQCKCVKFALTDYGRANKTTIAEDNYEFALSLTLTPKQADKQLRMDVHAQLFEKKNDNLKIKLAEIHVACTFVIQNFADLIQKDTRSNLVIPTSLINYCSSESLGIARGMFALRLEKTAYTNAILPLTDAGILTTIVAVTG